MRTRPVLSLLRTTFQLKVHDFVSEDNERAEEDVREVKSHLCRISAGSKTRSSHAQPSILTSFYLHELSSLSLGRRVDAFWQLFVKKTSFSKAMERPLGLLTALILGRS